MVSLTPLYRQLTNGFHSLHGAPSQLWVVYALKLLESYNYFSYVLVRLAVSFTLYLTEDFGISDVQAGSYYGLWGTLLTVFGFLVGPIIDLAGVRLCLMACFSIGAAARAVIALTTSRTTLVATLLGPAAVAESLGIPVMTIAVKRYTSDFNRGFAFALFYTVMNIAAMCVGPLFDLFRNVLRHGWEIKQLHSQHVLNDGYRLFMLTGCVSSLLALILSFFVGDPRPAQPPPNVFAQQAAAKPTQEYGQNIGAHEDERHDEDEQHSNDEDNDEHAATRPLLATETRSVQSQAQQSTHPQAQQSPSSVAQAKPLSWARMLKLNRQSSLLEGIDGWELFKYCVMCVFTVNLKTIFRHLEVLVIVGDMMTLAECCCCRSKASSQPVFSTPTLFLSQATLPKYLIRAFGCGTPIGLIYAINPTLILLLVPIVGAVTQTWSHFDMIHYGGYLSALSPLFLVAFNTLWSTVPFVVMLSMGEAIWSPRWYDYSMSVAPDGKEGLFTAAGSAPLFLATLPTGFLSGKLLAMFCPDTHACDHNGAAAALNAVVGRIATTMHGAVTQAVGECDGRLLWGIICAVTLTSPLLITFNQSWLRPCPQQDPLGRVAVDEDDPRLITAPVAEEDLRLPFAELEAELHEQGVVAGAHRHG